MTGVCHGKLVKTAWRLGLTCSLDRIEEWLCLRIHDPSLWIDGESMLLMRWAWHENYE